MDQPSITLDFVDRRAGARRVADVTLFSDPSNDEIIEQLRQIERATERRMVGVRHIRFPEDEAPAADTAAR
jgi:hypothetical protein